MTGEYEEDLYEVFDSIKSRLNDDSGELEILGPALNYAKSSDFESAEKVLDLYLENNPDDTEQILDAYESSTDVLGVGTDEEFISEHRKD